MSEFDGVIRCEFILKLGYDIKSTLEIGMLEQYLPRMFKNTSILVTN